MNELVLPQTWTVAAATVIVVLLCVGLHYEVLSGCTRYMPRLIHKRRPRVLVVILVVLVTHFIEMWFFAFGYSSLVNAGMGSLASTRLVAEGNAVASLFDYAYFSAMVYTTVGFGDVIPVGPIRLMAGIEALTGLVMITWSPTRSSRCSVTGRRDELALDLTPPPSGFRLGAGQRIVTGRWQRITGYS